MTLIPTAYARRLFLGAQGLLADPARKATRATLARLIEQMGFVQLDSINYVERAHHLTLGSRLDYYRHEHFTQLNWQAPEERGGEFLRLCRLPPVSSGKGGDFYV